MKTIELKNIPVGILLIASFWMFGALILFINVFTNPVGVCESIASAHGLSPMNGVEFVLIIAGLALTLGYGLIRLSRWGFILTLVYSLYLCFVSLLRGGLSFAWAPQPETQVYFGNFLWSALVVIYLAMMRRHFFHGRS